MKKRLLFLTILFSFSNVFAAGGCWQNEVDPSTNLIFNSASAYQQSLKTLRAAEPELPWYIDLYRGWRMAKEASVQSQVLKNDKQKHCYVGCRIAQDVGFATANYAGWKKEVNDLTDCNSQSRFEWADYKATQRGGELGDGTQGSNICFTSCEAEL